MKKILIIMNLLFILCMFIFSSSSFSIDMKYIVIDPGHGGSDAGCSYNEILEKDLNLKISLLLKEEYVSNGYNVILTRDGDYDLSSDDNHKKRTDLSHRVNIINNSNNILFISIHMNKYSKSSYYGSQVFYYKDSNKLLASSIQNSLKSVLKNTKRKEKELKGIYLLENADTPGVLVECGFLSNDKERELLLDSDYQKLISKAIYYGCIGFI